MRRECDHFRVRANTCRDRFCQPCAATRARIVANAIVTLMDGCEPRFVTLTLRHSEEPLANQLNRLYANYSQLRRRRLWRKHVVAAAATVEVTWNRNTRHWHPHLHVLVKGTFLPIKQLTAEWHEVTGDSFIVDIRRVPNPEQAARYIAKYVTKPMTHQYSRDLIAMDEAIIALKGRRLVLLTGEWKGLRTNDDRDGEHWFPVTSLETVVSLALKGDTCALFILRKIHESTERDNKRTKAPPDGAPAATG